MYTGTSLLQIEVVSTTAHLTTKVHVHVWKVLYMYMYMYPDFKAILLAMNCLPCQRLKTTSFSISLIMFDKCLPSGNFEFAAAACDSGHVRGR